jgi:hypothetical protein
MMNMHHLRRALALMTISAAAVAIQALPASATHESGNHLTFAPVASSPAPDANGTGIINYVKGTSTEEPNTQWTSSFHFDGLSAGATYSVVVRGRFADPKAFSTLCTFAASTSGNGGCATRFTGLQRLAVAQLRQGGTDGAPVLQATRQAVVAGPGSITSSGDCREPAQAGSTCDAPGRA